MQVYKYVAEERIDILINEHIRFTQPSEHNDPFELYTFIKSIPENDLFENFFGRSKLDAKTFQGYLPILKKSNRVAGNFYLPVPTTDLHAGPCLPQAGAKGSSIWPKEGDH